MNALDQVVFIAGCQRSGTTLLGAMLGGHSNALVTPECQFKRDLWYKVDWDQPRNEFLKQAVALLQHNLRFKLWDIALIEQEVLDNADITNYGSLMAYLVGKYGSTHGEKPHTSWWIDHDPETLAHAEAMASAFPQAKFIHIVRDPRAVAASVLPLDWGPAIAQDAGSYWKIKVQKALEGEALVDEGRVKRISYEDLLTNPRGVLQGVCDWLGLAFEEVVLEGVGLKLPSYTANQHAKVGRGLDATRMNNWETKLKPWEVALVEEGAQGLMQEMGYTPMEQRNKVGRWRRLQQRLTRKVRIKAQKRRNQERKAQIGG